MNRRISDGEIIRALRDGDLKGYEILFQRYYVRLRVFVKGVVKIDWVSEDIVQNVFMKLWDKRESIYGNSINNLVFTIARNEIADWFRSRYYSSRYASSAELPYRDDGFEEEFYATELADILDKAVNELSERRREVWNLSRRENLSNKEIALRLGVSVRTVDKHLEIAAKHIRDDLARSYKEPN